MILPAPLWRRKRLFFAFFFLFLDYHSTGLRRRKRRWPRLGSTAAKLPFATHSRDLHDGPRQRDAD